MSNNELLVEISRMSPGSPEIEEPDPSDSWIEEGVRSPLSPRAAFRFGHITRELLLSHKWCIKNAEAGETVGPRVTNAALGQPTSISIVTLEESGVQGAHQLKESPSGLVRITRFHPIKRLFVPFKRLLGQLAFDLNAQTCILLLDKITKLHRLLGPPWTVEIDPKDKPRPLQIKYNSRHNDVFLDIVRLADEAIKQTSRLGAIYRLGAAIGDYENRLLSLQPVRYDEVRYLIDLPAIDDVVSCIGSLPQPLIDRIELLRSLKTLVPNVGRFEKSRLIGQFVQRVRVVIPPESDWDLSNYRVEVYRPPYYKDLMYLVFVHLSNEFTTTNYSTLFPSENEDNKRPSWDHVKGELKFGDSIRPVASNARNARTILDAFELAGWREAIPNPLKTQNDIDSIPPRDAVKTLNQGLDDFHFCVSGGGAYVIWKPGPKPVRRPIPGR